MSFTNELTRVASFSDAAWQRNKGNHQTLKLARIGFHYSSSTNDVICCGCEMQIKVEDLTHNVEEEHRSRSPRCAMLNVVEPSAEDLLEKCRSLPECSGDQVDAPIELNTVIRNVYLELQRAVRRLKKLKVPLKTTVRPASSGLLDTVNNKSSESSPSRSSPRTLNPSSVFSAAPSESATFTRSVAVARAAVPVAQTIPDVEKMRYEEVRLNSYKNWPRNAPVQPESLAAAGLYYTGVADHVKCAFCEGKLHSWEVGDMAIEEHKRHFPSCKFILGQAVENVPIGRNDEEIRLSETDLTTSNRVVSVTAAVQSKTSTAQLRPKYPTYADVEVRERSFAGKVIPQGQNIQTLADAGYYHVGPQDNVKCFCCGGGLTNWQPDDDAWVEHAKWFPECAYLIYVKGQDFVRKVQNHKQSDSIMPKDPHRHDGAGTASIRSARYDSGVSTGRFSFEPREIKARLDSPMVKPVLDMGFSRDIVRRVIERRLAETGDDFRSLGDLLAAVVDIEEQDRGRQQSVASQAASTSSRAASTAAARPSPPLISAAAGPSASAGNIASVTATSATAVQPVLAAKTTDNAAADAATNAVASDPSFGLATAKKNGRKKKKKKKAKLDDSESVASNGKKGSSDEDNESKEGADLSGAATAAGLENRDELLAALLGDSEGRSILNENRQLKEARLCKICLDNEINTVFLPCGHLVCCNNCACSLKTCPICRQSVRGTVRTYLS